MYTKIKQLARKTSSVPELIKADAKVLKLFAEVAVRVPAYKDFLRAHDINPANIKTITDFKKLPLVDKKNYLNHYTLPELCWDGNLFNNRMISVSSGSTGSSFFWPRGEVQDAEGSWMHEQLFRKVFSMDSQSTLVIVCFSMGTWIAGSFTTASTLPLAGHGYDINLATPGLEKEEAIKVVKNLGHLYDQIVLAGYPPFIKDIIDDGAAEGIKWKKLKVRLLWAGEAFSEEWRDYVLHKIGSTNPYFDSANVYGSADAAMLGHESPVSIALRRAYDRKPSLRRELFGVDILPSIVQYYPEQRYFEQVDGELAFSAAAGIPLIRYNIHDSGGVLSLDEAINPVKSTYEHTLNKYGINENDWTLPLVYLNGRKDFTVTIYAVNIYPENIKSALVDPKMRSWATGKFTMATKYHSGMDQYFEINVELARGVKAEAAYQKIAEQTILTKLQRLNGEFHKLYAAIGNKALPQVHLIKHGDTEYFAKGVKHRWVSR